MKTSSGIARLLSLFILQTSSAYITNNNNDPHLQQSTPQRQFTKIPTPPFPDGPCSGRIVTIPGETLYNNKQKDNNSIFDTVLKSNPFVTSWEGLSLPKRDINVWLPREYDLMEFQKENFPILYCHDGQNGEQLYTTYILLHTRSAHDCTNTCLTHNPYNYHV